MDGIEPLVFDGVTKTCNLSARIHTDEDLEQIANNFIESGLYQKTLILLLGAKGEGLKLSVWAQSIKSNFKNKPPPPVGSSGYSSCNDDDNTEESSVNLTTSNSSLSLATESSMGYPDLKAFEQICISKPLDMFLALHQLQLIRLLSAKDCKNDIRIHLPASKLIYNLKFLIWSEFYD